MSHKGCLSVTKYFLFLFNLFFFILGSLVFGFGLWILFDQNNFASTLGSSYYALKIWSYIFSGAGILTMLLGFLGCLGSLKEIKCMLGLYFAFLLLLFVGQVTIAILIQTHSKTISSTVAGHVKTIIAGYGTNASLSDHGDSWDFVQEQGCRESVQTWLNNNLISIVGICLGIALLELFLMMVSMFLCRTVGPNYDKLARYS